MYIGEHFNLRQSSQWGQLLWLIIYYNPLCKSLRRVIEGSLEINQRNQFCQETKLYYMSFWILWTLFQVKPCL
jgi:hypothetical protein